MDAFSAITKKLYNTIQIKKENAATIVMERIACGAAATLRFGLPNLIGLPNAAFLIY